MPLEQATFIDDFVTSNPAASDSMAYADDHIRLIKGVLQNTFPGLKGPLTRSGGLIVPTGSASAPSYAFADEPTLGFHRSTSGLILITGGRLDGNGAVPVGSLHQFPKEPPGLVSNGAAEGMYLELNSATYQTADYPRLASFLGATGSTFSLAGWDVTDTGRFLRSRTTTVAAGTKQAHAFGSHSHSATTDVQGHHGHNVSGVTSSQNRNGQHQHTMGGQSRYWYGGGQGGQGLVWSADGQGFGVGNFTPTDITNTDHEHSVSGSTDGQGNHAHNVTVAANGASETRPEALSVIICIKT